MRNERDQSRDEGDKMRDDTPAGNLAGPGNLSGIARPVRPNEPTAVGVAPFDPRDPSPTADRSLRALLRQAGDLVSDVGNWDAYQLDNLTRSALHLVWNERADAIASWRDTQPSMPDVWAAIDALLHRMEQENDAVFMDGPNWERLRTQLLRLFDQVRGRVELELQTAKLRVKEILDDLDASKIDRAEARERLDGLLEQRVVPTREPPTTGPCLTATQTHELKSILAGCFAASNAMLPNLLAPAVRWVEHQLARALDDQVTAAYSPGGFEDQLRALRVDFTEHFDDDRAVSNGAPPAVTLTTARARIDSILNHRLPQIRMTVAAVLAEVRHGVGEGPSRQFGWAEIMGHLFRRDQLVVVAGAAKQLELAEMEFVTLAAVLAAVRLENDRVQLLATELHQALTPAARERWRDA